MNGVIASLALPPSRAALALALGMIALASGLFWMPAGLWLASLALAFPLAWASMVDIDRMILPDAITLPLIVSGLAIAAAQDWPTLLNHLLGTAVGFAFLTVVASSYRRVRGREGIGRGDIKLFAAAGAWLGLDALPFVMLVGSSAALILLSCLRLRLRSVAADSSIPFGPFLAVGVWVVWLSAAAGN